MISTFEKLGKDKLKELLAQCTEANRAIFHRKYKSVDVVPLKDINWAIQLCERTVAKNKEKSAKDEYEGPPECCSCHISAPCSYCISGAGT